MLAVMSGELRFINVPRCHRLLMFLRKNRVHSKGVPNETVWGMPKEPVAVCPGGVHLDFRSVCNLVDAVRCRVDPGSESMVDSPFFSYSGGGVSHLYAFMYAPPLC